MATPEPHVPATDRLSAVELLDDGRALKVTIDTGEHFRYHAIWLLDNAWDADTRDPGNGQKLVTVNELPVDVCISRAEILDAHLCVWFAEGNVPKRYAASFLLDNAYDRSVERESGWVPEHVEFWGAELVGSVPCADYAALIDQDEVLQDWLAHIRRFGFAHHDGPTTSGALLDLTARFGYVRETNYGKWFEVKSVPDPTNLAYSAARIAAHTDNPYRDPIPTMQLLYCIEDASEGGESIVVDGFAVAHELKRRDAQAFELLSRNCARFEYAGASDVRLSARKPIIELAPDGELIAVRFNNRSSAAPVDVPYDDMPAFYAALRTFAELVDDPAMHVKFKLNPGDSFIVDNTRVLHARTAFSSNGTRWLQGCYPERDGMLSTLRVLEQRTNS